MKGNKDDIIDYLTFKKESDIWVIEKITTKAGRSIAQNRTYWKIFKGIGDKLGYTKEEVRTNILTALFGTYEIKMFGKVNRLPNKTSTTELNKDEATKLIDASLEYAKKIDAGIEITPRDIQNLYNNN